MVHGHGQVVHYLDGQISRGQARGQVVHGPMGVESEDSAGTVRGGGGRLRGSSVPWSWGFAWRIRWSMVWGIGSVVRWCKWVESEGSCGLGVRGSGRHGPR